MHSMVYASYAIRNGGARRRARGWSCTRSHVSGQDVVRVAVEVVTRPVIAHSRARVSVPNCDLHVPQVHAGIQHGGHERVPEHMRCVPADPHACGPGQVPQAPRPADVQLQLRPARSQRIESTLGTPRQEAPQIRVRVITL
jgi:hypothetical protein